MSNSTYIPAKEFKRIVKEEAWERLERLGFAPDKEESFGGLIAYSMRSGEEKWIAYFQRSSRGNDIALRLWRRTPDGIRKIGALDWIVLSQGGTWRFIGDFVPFTNEADLREAVCELLDVFESLGMKWFRREIEFHTWLSSFRNKDENENA
ncbi:MAG: hypothetical protein ACM3ZU_03340 [Bacteroidota bacterium]